MAFSAWKVAVLITGQNLSGPAFASLSTQAGAANAKVTQVRASVLALRAAALASFAAIGAAMIKDGVQSAAKLEIAMTNIGNATGATRRQLEGLRGTVLSVSGATAQSAVTIAQEMAQFARSTAFGPSQIQALFPTVARFADNLFLSRGADPVTSVKQAVQLAHYFKAWDPASMGKMIDQTNRLMNVQGEDLGRVVSQGKYFIPMATSLGIDQSQIFDYLALMGQTGFLLGRGGTGMERVLLGAINAPALTQTLQYAKIASLLKLGMIGTDGKPTYLTESGGLALQPLMTDLLAARQKFGAADFARMIYSVFGAQGQQLLMTINDPRVSGPGGQLDKIKVAMARQQGVAAQQAAFMATLQGSWNQFATNFQNVAIAIFYPTLPVLTRLFGAMAHELSLAAGYLTAHPQTAFAIAVGAFVAVGAAAVGAAATTWQLVRALWALSGSEVVGGGGRMNPAFLGVREAERVGARRGLGRLLMNPFAEGGLVGGAAAGFGARIGGAARFLFGGLEQREGFKLFTPGFLRTGGLVAGGQDFLGGMGARIGALAEPGLAGLAKVGSIASIAATGLLELGVRILGIVTWVGLAAQALQFFATHPKEIGKWIGEIGGFIYYQMWPLIQKALTWVWGEVVNIFVGMAQAIWNVVSWLGWAVIHPIQAGIDIKRWGGNLVGGVASGFASQAPGPTIHAPVTFQYGGPMDAKAAKQHAKQFVDYVNRLYPHAVRSSSSSPRGLRFAPATLGSLGNPR